MSSEGVPGGGRRSRPPLTLAQILAWADDHRARTGAWPSPATGPVAAAAGETWPALNVALRLGHRGLPGGDTLARLLRRERGAGIRRGRPPDPARQQEAARLRAEGLTLAAIGRRLGVSPQRVCELLRPPAAGASPEGTPGQPDP